MHTPFSAAELESALTQCRQHCPDLFDHGVSGHCDAVALALKDYLDANNTEATLQAIGRTRQAIDDGQVIDENPLSHVVVGAMGTQWDITGPGAMDRWEEEWIQPEEDDEVMACEDVFDGVNVTACELEALRQARDNRSPDPQIRKQAFEALSRSVANIQLEARLTVLDSPLGWMKNYYTRGGCHELAVALHRDHGFEIAVAHECDGMIHVYGIDRQEQAWDIGGARPWSAITQEMTIPGVSGPLTLERFASESEFVEQYVATGDFDRQLTRPLSAYTPNEIARAGQVARDLLCPHPAFPGTAPSPRRSGHPRP